MKPITLPLSQELDARRQIEKKTPKESEIEAAVIVYARSKKWLCFKLSATGVRGAPDRLLVSPVGTVVWIEFKTPKGRVSASQARVHKALAKTGHHVRVIRSEQEGINLINTTIL